jgi:uncharacterized repeat protein (TIGR03803 family)
MYSNHGQLSSHRRRRRSTALLGLLIDALEPRILMAANSPDYNFALLASFTGPGKLSNGAAPQGLIMDGDGNLFGITAFGGSAGLGTIFEIAAGTNTIVTQASFTLDQGINGSPGIAPIGNLALWLDPHTGLTHLYGTATSGGGTSTDPSASTKANGRGTIWDWVVGSDTVNALAFFTGDNGANPLTGVIVDPASGDLYGTASASTHRAGNTPTVWKLPHGSNSPEILATFKRSDHLSGSLVLDSQGNLFGTTGHAGTGGRATVFEIPANSTGSTTVALLGAAGINANPDGSLLLVENGGIDTIYGTTAGGGSRGLGAVFSLTDAAGSSPQLTTLVSFAGGSKGSRPLGTLVMDSSGSLIGISHGGDKGGGTVFKVTHPENGTNATLTLLHSFSSRKNGINPTWPLVLDASDNLFGATFRGGAKDTGAIWELSPTSNAFTVVQTVITQQPSSAIAGQTLAPLSITLEDVFGNTVTAGTENLTLQILSGPDGATLAGTTTVASVNGIATFNDIQLTRAGTYLLVATDGTRTSLATRTITIRPAAAAQLVFLKQPSQALINAAAVPVVVAVEDSFGNIVNTSGQKITITAAGPGSLTGSRTVSAVRGIATFQTLKLDQAGAYTLTAVDGASGDGPLANAAGTPFDVLTTQLSFAGTLKNRTAGANLGSIKVHLLDAQGRLLTSFNGDVTLEIDSGPDGASLDGTTTVTAVNGVATFTGLTLTTAGTYTLRALADAAVTGISQSFTISAAAAAQVLFLQQPTDAFVSTPLDPPLQVAVADQFGNVLAKDRSRITLTIDSGPGGAALLHVAPINLNGVRTFADVRLDTAGTYTLQASDGSLVSAVSDSFIIT